MKITAKLLQKSLDPERITFKKNIQIKTQMEITILRNQIVQGKLSMN